MTEPTQHPDDGASTHLYALPAGARLNEYEIRRVLGHGGFGITYLALDSHLNKSVAIKEYLPSELAARVSDASVRPKSTADEPFYRQGREAFLNEARMLARFEHPSIVKVHRFFEANGTAYIVLDYLEGRPLDAVLSDGRLDGPALTALLGKLLDGLSLIHAGATLHRDIKPSNIMIGRDGAPVLIDFGSARNFYGLHSRDVTTIVSPGYSPPEQFGVSGHQGPWTDLYALGAVAYRCVTGQSPPESLRRLRHDPYVPVLEAAKDKFDPRLLRAIDWALKIEERERPQSAEAFRAALAPESAAPVIARRRRGTAAPLWLSLIVLAALGGGAASWFAWWPRIQDVVWAKPDSASVAAKPVATAPAAPPAQKADVSPGPPAPAKATVPIEAYKAALTAIASMSAQSAEVRYRVYDNANVNKAQAATPGTQTWYTSSWDNADVAAEKTLEACQVAHGTPCVLVAVNDRIETGKDPRDMPRVGYSGLFDPERVPTLRRRADAAGYRAAPAPKAAALHAQGRFFPVSGAATLAEAEAQALAACNNDPARAGRDGPCFLYASGDLVVLSRRLLKPLTPP